MTIPTVDQGGSGSISALHCDVIRAHILTRLDGPSLASTASTSSQLKSLSNETSLWSDLCSSTWPSTNAPRVQKLIASFPGGHRSFFSDCFPVLSTSDQSDRRRRICGRGGDEPEILISAVDLRYRGEVILSRTVETETDSGWFDHSPFIVDLLPNRKDATVTAVRFPGGDRDADSDEACHEIADGLELSWVVAGARRAANISSLRPVSVRRHAVTGDVHASFATVISGGGEEGSASELVRFSVSVTCGGSHTGMMHVREVCLTAEDMEGVHLNGGDSLVILRRAMRGKRGKVVEREEEGKRRHEEFLESKRERIERQVRNEGVLDLVSASLVGGFAILSLFWAIKLYYCY